MTYREFNESLFASSFLRSTLLGRSGLALLGLALLGLALLGLALLGLATSAFADDEVVPVQTELFEAIESKQIEVTVIAHDYSRLTLKIENQTRTPLRIALPTVFAAVPLQPLGADSRRTGLSLPQDSLSDSRQPYSQQLGGAFTQSRSGNEAEQLAYEVGPRRTVRKKVSCVCLEFGKPDPTPKIPYELRELKQVTEEPAVQELLERLGTKTNPLRVVQLATWNVANQVPWNQLARIPRPRSRSRTLFTTAELQQAKALVQQLTTD